MTDTSDDDAPKRRIKQGATDPSVRPSAAALAAANPFGAPLPHSTEAEVEPPAPRRGRKKPLAPPKPGIAWALAQGDSILFKAGDGHLYTLGADVIAAAMTKESA